VPFERREELLLRDGRQVERIDKVLDHPELDDVFDRTRLVRRDPRRGALQDLLVVTDASFF